MLEVRRIDNERIREKQIEGGQPVVKRKIDFFEADLYLRNEFYEPIEVIVARIQTFPVRFTAD